MILSAISWAAVYFVVWWTSLFVVLPFAGRGRTEAEAEADSAIPGAERGAPQRTPLLRLFVATTLVASVVFLAIYVVLTYRLISLDQIPLLPRFEPVR